MIKQFFHWLDQKLSATAVLLILAIPLFLWIMNNEYNRQFEVMMMQSKTDSFIQETKEASKDTTLTIEQLEKNQETNLAVLEALQAINVNMKDMNALLQAENKRTANVERALMTPRVSRPQQRQSRVQDCSDIVVSKEVIGNTTVWHRDIVPRKCTPQKK